MGAGGSCDAPTLAWPCCQHPAPGVISTALNSPAHGAAAPCPAASWWGLIPALLTPPCRIKHPNIVALDDIYESSSHLYLIMQL